MLDMINIFCPPFLKPEELETFRKIVVERGKGFSFKSDKKGCASPEILALITIFMVPRVAWTMKPIPIPNAALSTVVVKLKQKPNLVIVVASSGPHSKKWFTVKK